MQLSSSSYGPLLTGQIEEVTCPVLFALAAQIPFTGEIDINSHSTDYSLSYQEGSLVGMQKNFEPLAPNMDDLSERDRIGLFVKEIAEIFSIRSGEFTLSWRDQPQHSLVEPERIPIAFLLRYGMARTPDPFLVNFLFQAIFPYPTTVNIFANQETLQLMGGKAESELRTYQLGQTVLPNEIEDIAQQGLVVLWCLMLLETATPNPITPKYHQILHHLQHIPIDGFPIEVEPIWEVTAPASSSSQDFIIDLKDHVIEEGTLENLPAFSFQSPPLHEQDVQLEIPDLLLQALDTSEAINALLSHMETWRASDLFLSEDKQPAVRVNGSVVALELPVTQGKHFEDFLQQTLTAEARARFAQDGDLDMGHSLTHSQRFRINLHRQKGATGLVARAIPTGNLSFEDLGLPTSLQKMAELQRGLILVTGATGSGKSTTLAAMVHHINTHRQAHIVTIEEPIEFIHHDIKSRITQREVGSDTTSFHAALKHVVRESPDVILIGEMRDMETMQVALSAALTGHLVLATLHTINAVQTLQRIMSYYPEHLRHQVATDLSLSLRGIVSQRLIPTSDGEQRVAAIEMLTATPAVAQLLRQQRLTELHDVLENDNDPGIQSFNLSLLKLYQQDQITYEMGQAYATNPDQFALMARGMATGVATFRQEANTPTSGLDIKSLLQLTMEQNASDLHLTVGRPPIFRINGSLIPMKVAPLSPGDMRTLLYSTLSTPQRTNYQLEREIDFALALENGQRFRINAYYQKGKMAASLRAIPSELPDPKQIAIPETILEMIDAPHGLMLVTGPTGSGKSTTLACMIDRINRTRPCRIITIEDPIEFTHTSKMATVDQREVLSDTKTFASALKYILRQDPDVVLIGEMRDRETIAAALTAAETGHLVLATLHTNSAIQTVARIIDVFPAHQQPQVRSQLSTSLLGVIAQRLLPRKGGEGRIPAFEIMMASPAIRNLIREDKMHQAQGIMESSRSMGMITMDTFLQRLYEAGVVEYRDAMRYITNPTILDPSLHE